MVGVVHNVKHNIDLGSLGLIRVEIIGRGVPHF